MRLVRGSKDYSAYEDAHYESLIRWKLSFPGAFLLLLTPEKGNTGLLNIRPYYKVKDETQTMPGGTA